MLIRFEEKHAGLVEKAYIKMIPGTKYEGYFRSETLQRHGFGWVYKKWLWAYEKEEEIK